MRFIFFIKIQKKTDISCKNNLNLIFDLLVKTLYTLKPSLVSFEEIFLNDVNVPIIFFKITSAYLKKLEHFD